MLNVITGRVRVLGAELTGNPLVRKITFTGSTEVGRVLIEQSAATVKKLSMELAGNAPFLVFDDADMEQAVAGLIATKYRNTGQAWLSANRVYAQDGIYDAFTRALTDAVGKLKVGDGFEPGVQQGPLPLLPRQQLLCGVVSHAAEPAVQRGAVKVTAAHHFEQSKGRLQLHGVHFTQHADRTFVMGQGIGPSIRAADH